ncbi:hypothetical protein TIFTF001_031800 [Ficus carica]|uniref:Uncharacterized protein n=1 Tax=Ficus carica TaxID=3494 RepID=A0AA88DX73_FICCA|nr:hypothetical protein TIFTF001_031800 [Ficus carica]
MNDSGFASEHEEDNQAVENKQRNDARMLAMAVGATNQHILYLFQHSKETNSRWFFKVLKVICALNDEFIRPPDYTSVQH